MKEGFAVNKTVLPNVGQAHEFFRQLKDRGVGVDLVQLAIQDPDPVAQFLLECYGRKFSPKVRQELQFADYKIVRVPGILEAPVTLNQLYRRAGEFGAKFRGTWHEDFTPEALGEVYGENTNLDGFYFPLPPGEIAWMPSDPLIPGSTKKRFAEQEKIVTDYSRQIQERFGDGVEAIFPTAEQAVLVLFNHRRQTGTYALSDRYTQTVNCFRSYRLYVGYFGENGVRVFGWHPGGRSWNLGVLRLVVPARIDK